MVSAAVHEGIQEVTEENSLILSLQETSPEHGAQRKTCMKPIPMWTIILGTLFVSLRIASKRCTRTEKTVTIILSAT